MYAELKRCKRRKTERLYIVSRAGRAVAGRGEREHFLLGIIDEPVRVHRDRIVLAKKTKRARFLCGGRHLGERDRLKRTLAERELTGARHVLRNRIHRDRKSVV